MQKFYSAKLSAFILAALVILTFSACQLKESNEEEGEGSRYDGPAAALEFEIERTMDPSLGRVPWEKLRIAKEQTFASSRNPNRVTALSWEERGPNGDFTMGGNSRPNQDQTAGRMRALMVDSLDATHKTVFAGSVAGGLWKTTDITVAPANWTPIGDLSFNNLSIAAICQDPRTGFQNNMYLCTGESYGNADAVQGVGVFKSTDGGATWTFLSSTSSYVSGTRIVCDNQGNVYLGTRGNGLLRSTDGGTTWTNIAPGGFTRVADLKISSTGRMHATFGIFSAGGYRYCDAPSTATTTTGWSTATTPFTIFSQRTEFAVSGNTLYALPCDASYQVPTIWKSTDGGDTWIATTGQPNASWASGQGWYALSVAIHPSNPDICIVGGLDCHKTLDGGATWTKISTWASTSGQYVHADQHNIQWWDQGFKLAFACDGGIHYSADAGNTIRDRNKGLRVKQFYGISIHPTLPNYFIAGAQDNGVHRMNHVGLDSSAEVAGGDGCLTAIDQDEPQYQFGSYVYNVFRKSTNNGASWSSFTISSSIGRFVNPWDYDNTGNKIYSCYSAGSYVRWDNPQTGTTTNVVSIADFASQTVSSVNVSPNTANRVFFGTGNGRVVRVDNADQATPTSAVITPFDGTGSASGYVNCVTMGSTDDHLMAIYSNYGVNNIWVSHDAGATWTRCDGNLPDMPVRWALFSPNGDDKAYIATETGVWETDLLDGVRTVWSANPTFPNVRVDMIKYRASDRTIAAGTHGRGIWSATVPLPYGFAFNNPAPATATCPAPASMSVTLGTVSSGGFTGAITLTATGNPAGTTVSFSPSPVNGGSSSTVTLNGTSSLAPGTYNVTVTGTASGVTTQTRVLTYTINTGTGPTISSQPSNQTVCAGSAASFSITANGTSYQWQQSTDGGTTWTSISGATTTTYSISSAALSASGYQYRCIASNQCTSTTSTVGLLTVNTTLSIATQPADATTCAGVNASFSVVGQGATGYQWQQSTDGGTNWSNITGATSASYTVSAPTVAMSGYKYRCVVTGTCTPFTATSNAGTLTVVSSLSITTQPSSVTTCEGTAASFTIVAVGASSYQWQVSTDGGTTFTNVAGATSATYSIASPTAAQNGYKYRCQLSSSCGSATSSIVTLTVNTLPAISAQPQSTSICAGSNNTFSVTATGTGITYQWQLSTTGCAGTFTNITGATSSTYVVTAATASQNGYAYRCVVSGTCTPAVTSSCALLTVIVPTTVSTNPNNVTICDGSNTSFTVAGTGAGIIYQWQVNTGSGFVNVTDGGVYSGATTATLTLTGVNTTYNNYQYRCQLSNSICTTPAVSSLATLTVNSLPAITTSPVSQTVCTNATVSFVTAATGTGIGYQWQVNTGTGFTNIANGGVYSGATTNTLVITGITVSLNSYQYRCVVSGTCTPAANSAAATLTVHAPVVIATNPANKEVCAGIDATFNAAGLSVPAVIYQWQSSTNGGTSWSAVTGATSPSYTAVAPTTSASGTLYRCLVSSATCPTTASTTSALLTVRAVPLVGLTASPLTALLPGQSTVLTATPDSSTGGAITTTWTQNGTAFVNAGNTYTVTVNNLGTYQVGIRETWPSTLYCASLSQAVTISATASSNLFIYPSPNDGNFTVSYYNSTGVSTSRQIAVFDAKGARVFFKTFSVSGPYTLIPVDMTRASRGNYFVVVADAAGNKLIEGKVSIAK